MIIARCHSNDKTVIRICLMTVLFILSAIMA